MIMLYSVVYSRLGGSYHMEKEGLKRCLDHLESNDLAVEYIVTDRHPQIQKFLRERNLEQFYDVWHFEKGLSKKLLKVSQNKDCKVLKKWLCSIKNHVYWSATSTTSGPEKVARWTSVVNHLQNIHVHDDPLFPKCSHPERASSHANKWLKLGSITLAKVERILNNKRVLKDVRKLSHHYQTSSLESSHSLILRFAPRTQSLFGGMRVLLYVGELMRLVFEEVFEDPAPFVEEMNTISIPKDLSTQFDRPSKEEVVTPPAMSPVSVKGRSEANLLSSRIRKLLAYPADNT
ncbi:uncharacterized protein [Notothenia coriiceps]|uniref:Uncharacterized protein n=1 Tax=Notothenia coriiceps TaxID=8208 RepID=A0A6I9P350_9TELE|nr:PREDICTED: uncharacterized protein LOC104955751 [Notothenia coriiceps]